MRRTHHTIMLVCEGYAEDEFARVIRDLYLERNCGTILQRKNARGNGGARALQLAMQLKRETAHDAYGVLIDTDQHWGDGERAQARASEIHAIENTPCLEATLLQIDGQNSHRLTRDNKAAFEEQYGGPANREGVIRRNFTREKFELARTGRWPMVGGLHWAGWRQSLLFVPKYRSLAAIQRATALLPERELVPPSTRPS